MPAKVIVFFIANFFFLYIGREQKVGGYFKERHLFLTINQDQWQ